MRRCTKRNEKGKKEEEYQCGWISKTLVRYFRGSNFIQKDKKEEKSGRVKNFMPMDLENFEENDVE